MSKVSVIVPIYNVEEYISKCLDSLTKQTFKDIEIWAISDGSPDNSVQIVKEFAMKDSRIKCIEKENGGYGSVLEYAINNIQTDYFLICDPDDWISENAIELLYQAASSYDLDFVVGRHNDVYSNDLEEVKAPLGADPRLCDIPFNKVCETKEDLEKFLFISESPHGKLYKTSLAKGIEFPHKISYTDAVLYLLYILKVKKAMYIDETVAYYLLEREGNTRTDAKPQIADYFYTIFSSIMDQYEKGNIKCNAFYFKMFLKQLEMNASIAQIGDEKEFKEKLKISYSMLERCLKHRNEIINEMNKKPYMGRKGTAYKLLLNPVTSKLIFNYLSNKIYKAVH